MTENTWGREPILESEFERQVWAWLIATVGEGRARQGLAMLSEKQRSYPLNVARRLKLELPPHLQKPQTAKPNQADASEHSGPTQANRSTPAPTEPAPKTRTYSEVRTQLEAISCGTGYGFNLGLLNAATDQFLSNWTPRKPGGLPDDATDQRTQESALSIEEIEEVIPVLGHRNLHGMRKNVGATELGENKENIYVRARWDKGSSIVLVDDLSRDSYDQMCADGIVPAILVQTSPQSHQAWVVLPRVMQSDGREYWPEPTRRETVARYLAATYRGDMASAKATQFGRLAGFRNCKLKYRQPNGHYPFVTCVRGTNHGKPCNPKLYDLAEAWRVETAKHTDRVMREITADAVRDGQLEDDDPARVGRSRDPGDPTLRFVIERFARSYAEFAIDRGLVLDDSRRDWHIALVLAKQGFTVDAVIAGMLRSDMLGIQARKIGRSHYYAALTATRAHCWMLVERQAWQDRQDLSYAQKADAVGAMVYERFRETLDQAKARDQQPGA